MDVRFWDKGKSSAVVNSRCACPILPIYCPILPELIASDLDHSLPVANCVTLWAGLHAKLLHAVCDYPMNLASQTDRAEFLRRMVDANDLSEW